MSSKHAATRPVCHPSIGLRTRAEIATAALHRFADCVASGEGMPPIEPHRFTSLMGAIAA